MSPPEPVKSLVGGIAAGVFIAGLLLGVTCGVGITLNVTRCRRQLVDVSNMNICGFIVSLFIAKLVKHEQILLYFIFPLHRYFSN